MNYPFTKGVKQKKKKKTGPTYTVPDVSAPSLGSIQVPQTSFQVWVHIMGGVCVPSSFHDCLHLLGFMRMNLKEEIPWTIIGKGIDVGSKGTSCPLVETKSVNSK